MWQIYAGIENADKTSMFTNTEYEKSNTNDPGSYPKPLTYKPNNPCTP